MNLSSVIIGEPFTILNEDFSNSSEIWYYPVYYDNKIQFLLEIYYYQDKLYCGISQEYVLRLNEINYSSDMRIVKEKDNIYAIDDEDCQYVLKNNEFSNLTDVESFSKTSKKTSNMLGSINGYNDKISETRIWLYSCG